MTAILLFSIGVSLAYIMLLYSYLKGWESLPVFIPGENIFYPEVSVIIAFRDEEENLPGLIHALLSQSYPSSGIEILFADDHSSDNSARIIEEHAAVKNTIKLIRLGEPDTGKKRALAISAAQAKGKLLLFTDADCLPGKDWITTIVSFYQETGAKLIASPVQISPVSGYFGRFQSLEFFSLTGSTAGSFGCKDPVMVNGANLAVERDAYLESLPHLRNQVASGDDIFLLLYLKKKYPGELAFLKSLLAVVSVKPLQDFSDFIRQRLRWTSKARLYRDKAILLSAFTVLILNLWLLNCLVMSFINVNYLFIGGGVFMIKSIIDFIFLRRVLLFFRMESLLKFFVLSQFLYFLYISFTGIAGNLFSSRWKGRVVK